MLIISQRTSEAWIKWAISVLSLSPLRCRVIIQMEALSPKRKDMVVVKLIHQCHHCTLIWNLERPINKIPSKRARASPISHTAKSKELNRILKPSSSSEETASTIEATNQTQLLPVITTSSTRRSCWMTEETVSKAERMYHSTRSKALSVPFPPKWSKGTIVCTVPKFSWSRPV